MASDGTRFTFTAGRTPADTFAVVNFKLKQSLSSLFSLDISVACNDPAIGFQKILDEYRRMTLALRKEGFTLNHKTVRKLMKQHGLTCHIRRKKYRSYMPGGGPASDNLLARNFRAEHSGMKWCTDVTEFRVGEHKLYLSVVQDMYSHEIVAWHISRSPSQRLAAKCWMRH